MITLKEKDASLSKVLTQIQKQTGYSFFLSDETTKEAKPITIEVKNATLKQVLDICFKDQPFTYQINQHAITITPKKNNSKDLPKPIDIKGRVVNEKGEPVLASITVKGTTKGTATNKDGWFVLTGVEESATLIVSGVGIETTEIKADGRTQLEIAVRISVRPLDEVQMIAYGQTTKRFQTGNVSTLKGTEIEKQPVSNPIVAMEGRVPGLYITQSNGLAGGNVKFNIQGQNSILQGNAPLIVVDGVPYVSELPTSTLANNAGIGGSPLAGGSPLSFINPGDIERIDVLKDADATAIYGSRAANGALLITTKSGKADKTRVDINFYQGVGKVPKEISLMNTRQYLDMRYEGLQNDGISPIPDNQYDLTLWDTTKYTNWQKEMIGRTASYTNAQVALSGGGANTKYLVSGTYHRETTVFPENYSDQKASAHFSLNSASADKRFNFQLSQNFMYDYNRLPVVDFTNYITLAPNAPDLKNPDGSLNWVPNADGTSTINNPLQNIYINYKGKTINLINNAVLSYNLTPYLSVKSNFGYTFMQINEYDAYQPLIAVRPEDRPYTQRSALYGNSNVNSWIVEPQLIFSKSMGGGDLEGLVGTTFLQNTSKGNYLVGTGYNSDAAMEDIHSAASIVSGVTTGSNVNAVYKYQALFGRITYNWQKKYILNLTGRRDGSSRFGADNRFHNFGSVGAAWIFSNEKWSTDELKFLSFGKIKGSYGTTGNDQIGDYQYFSLYNPTTAPVPYQGNAGLAASGFPNPYLQWEVTKKLQGGVELGFVQNKILLTANYVHNKSSNQLLNYSLPSFTGSEQVYSNFPAVVENTSWELTLNTFNIKKRNFEWTSSFNLTIPKNKLVSFPDLATSTYAERLVVGQPVNIVKAYQYLGVDPATGLYSFSDGEKGMTSNPDTILNAFTQMININPKYYGGFENNFTYKRFQLTVFLQFVKKLSPRYIPMRVPGRFQGGFNNQPEAITDRWQKPGDIAYAQKYSSNFSLFSTYFDLPNSSYAYEDGSFIRLKNLYLSYEFSDELMKSMKLRSCRLFIQGQNLFTITSYKGLDPETASLDLALPPLRVLTFGINVGL
ncbi:MULTISPECIES: SusC/RagA family TonB-linked outer membrane protein [Niastella]|uniref:SusC/RagA family TonB-linked outer membrane protein n=1 Tax=Niastella soli TaxID=2821487 RepID=A0ABS3Z3E3_9BACT|nr:SusC/RagA family TonB-linked outer membrane protein [Niastella soli]MBO9204654.1 SusC/RagA family TonB-linked outer membrane protein [Niastella soli]